MIYVGLLILGLGSGVLINLLADDLPGRVLPGRPHCMACGRPFHPSQWLALTAWLTGRGRCAQCGTPLRWRKLAVEIASAVLLVFLYQRFDATPKGAFLALLLECLLLITVIDLEHRLILYITLLPAAGAALLYGVFGAGGEPGQALTRTLIGGAAGFGVFYIVYRLGIVYSAWVARRRGQPLDEDAFGRGDANLGGVVGLAVGWPAILLTVFYTVMSGGLVAALFLVVMFLRRRNALLIPIPYGPFIVFGAVMVLVFSADVSRLYGFTP